MNAVLMALMTVVDWRANLFLSIYRFFLMFFFASLMTSALDVEMRKPRYLYFWVFLIPLTWWMLQKFFELDRNLDLSG